MLIYILIWPQCKSLNHENKSRLVYSGAQKILIDRIGAIYVFNTTFVVAREIILKREIMMMKVDHRDDDINNVQLRYHARKSSKNKNSGAVTGSL